MAVEFNQGHMTPIDIFLSLIHECLRYEVLMEAVTTHHSTLSVLIQLIQTSQSSLPFPQGFSKLYGWSNG